jgi:hypothetical protein
VVVRRSLPRETVEQLQALAQNVAELGDGVDALPHPADDDQVALLSSRERFSLVRPVP